MPGRTRGRMFAIRPENEIEDTGTGAYPGYPGYGDSDVAAYDEYEDHYAEQDARGAAPAPRNGHDRNGNGRPAPARDGNGRPAPGQDGRRAPARNGNGRPARDGAGRSDAGTTGRNDTGRTDTGRNGTGRTATGRYASVTGGPAATTATRGPDRDDRVSADGRWDDDEPPLLSHRGEPDEPAYARDRTPQGFDGGDPDDPHWGRGTPSDEYDYDADDYAADDYDEGDDEEDYDEDEYGVGDAPLSVPPPGSGGRPLGPADVEELDPSMTDALARVDLGSVQVPVPYGADFSLEPAGAARPQAVHLMLPEGRIAVSALASPRTSGLWPDLASEIEQSLRKGGARVRSTRGDWGRELHARTENAASVFVGCDGPRWMVYGVATASLETVEALDVELRRVLRGIVVVRGKSPYPPRTVLPLELPAHMREAKPDTPTQKPSITVSVAGSESGATPSSTGAIPAAGRTASTTTGADPRETSRPAGPPARRAPAASGPVAVPVRRPDDPTADPATRDLPAVRRPAASAPAENAAERTAVARPMPVESATERTAVARPTPPAGPAERTTAPAAEGGGRYARRPGRPDRRSSRPLERPAATSGSYPAPARPEPVRAEPVRPAAEVEPAPLAAELEPQVRRDPAVTALSMADLLVTEPPVIEPPVTDLPAGPEADPARSGPADSGPSATDGPPSGLGSGVTVDPAPSTVAPEGGRAARRRAENSDRVSASELLAGFESTPEPVAVTGPLPRPSAIEDIPLSDVDLVEATLDREPEPPAAPPVRRPRRERAPVTGADEWLSTEIAASRRAGRHGSGGTSVADLLASAGLDGLGSPATAAPVADEHPGYLGGGPGDAELPEVRSEPWRESAPSADEARSALRDLLRNASVGDGEEFGGNSVTGLDDYRAGRAAATGVGEDLLAGYGQPAGESVRRGEDADPRDLGKHRRD